MKKKSPIYLYVTPFFPSEQCWRGGFSLDAVKALIADGEYDVRVMIAGCGDGYVYDGVQVNSFRRVQLPCGIMPFFTERINRYLFRRALLRMGIDIFNVAVCHVNQILYAEYGVEVKELNPRAQIKLQHHFQCPVHLKSGRLGIIPGHATMLYFYWRRLCELMDVHSFVGERCRETFWKTFHSDGSLKPLQKDLWLGSFLREVKEPVSVIEYIQADRELFFQGEKIAHEGFVIGCAANFWPQKDHITLIKAVEWIYNKGYKNVRLRLVGSGETREMCERYVGQKNLTNVVSFECERPHREMPYFYRELDLFVLPSRRESYSAVLSEAYECGIPILMCCGDCGFAERLPQKIKAECIIPPGDVSALADKIEAQIKSYTASHFSA